MEKQKDHISVCICTFKRPILLKNLLEELLKQRTDDLFTYSIVVVDNDFSRSAENIVLSFKEKSIIEISYDCEPEQNIALARNKAIKNAKGNFIAFIDDDEFPKDTEWLLKLYEVYYKFKVDGVLGPVLPHYDKKTPHWVIKGRFYERPSHITGSILNWQNTRTGNVLLSRNIFVGDDNKFRAKFGRGGEDRDFFRRMIEKGFRFIWCAEAPVYEYVPLERCSRSFMLKRAIVRGTQPHFTIKDYLKSMVAIPLYTLILPFSLFIGQYIFMKLLIKIFDHFGRLSYFIGFNLIKERYVQK